jgi:hypothetical protein
MGWRQEMNIHGVAVDWPIYKFYETSPDGIGEFDDEVIDGSPEVCDDYVYNDPDFKAKSVSGGFVITNPDDDVIGYAADMSELQDWIDSVNELDAIEQHMRQLEKTPEVVDFDDLGLTATLIPEEPDDPSGSTHFYSIMDKDGNTIDYVNDMHQLQDYMDKRREERDRLADFDAADLVGNPRVVFLWDRINGNTVIEEYVAYIVRRNLVERGTDNITIFQQSENPLELTTRAANHAKNTANKDFEWVVVVLPIGKDHNKRQNRGATDEKLYAKHLAAQVLDANIREMLDKAREPS